ncbi:MAG: globin family protein [Planctomycetaceae bacterium]
MGLNVELLEQSFEAVSPRAAELADVFYRNLFADYPQVRPLFEGVDQEEQKKKLVASLVLVVNNLRKPDVLVPALENLGARHVDYGTEEAHYPAVGATLLKSLAEIAGDAWTPELTEAWSDAYQEITKHMLAGANATVTTA